MTAPPPNIISYQTPPPHGSQYTPFLVCSLIVAQPLWHFMMAFALFFFLPYQFELLMYDQRPWALVGVALMAAPSLVAIILALATLLRKRTIPLDISYKIMAIVSLSIGLAYTAWIFWRFVIVPVDPRTIPSL